MPSMNLELVRLSSFLLNWKQKSNKLRLTTHSINSPNHSNRCRWRNSIWWCIERVSLRRRIGNTIFTKNRKIKPLNNSRNYLRTGIVHMLRYAPSLTRKQFNHKITSLRTHIIDYFSDFNRINNRVLNYCWKLRLQIKLKYLIK